MSNSYVNKTKIELVTKVTVLFKQTGPNEVVQRFTFSFMPLHNDCKYLAVL